MNIRFFKQYFPLWPESSPFWRGEEEEIFVYIPLPGGLSVGPAGSVFILFYIGETVEKLKKACFQETIRYSVWGWWDGKDLIEMYI